MTPPKYQEINHDMMPRYNLPGGKGVLEIIAGEYDGLKGPASTFTPMHVYNARLKSGADIELRFPQNFNTGLLVIEGSASIKEQAVPTDQFVLFHNDGELIRIKPDEEQVMLLLSDGPCRA